jgi:hypothetical protein
MDLSPGTVTWPVARADGDTVAVPDHMRIFWTIAFAFASGIGLVLHFKPVQPEAVLSSTFTAPQPLRAAGGPH